MSRTRVPNQELATDAARANLLVNGGFEVWQRGNGPMTVSGAYAADRWSLQIGGAGTISASRDTSNVDGGGVCLACTYTPGAGDGVPGIYQPFAQAAEALIAQLRGKTISGSIRVKTTVTGVRPWIQANGTRVYGAAHPADGAYHTLTVTATLAATEPVTYFGVEFTVGAGGTAYLDNAMVVLGSVAADYVPIHPADDLARCLRYYESYSLAGGYFRIGPSYAPAAAGYVADQTVLFRARKAGTPTVTVNSAGWALVGAGTPYTLTPGPDSTVLEIAANAAGMFYANLVSNTIPGLIVEANP